MSRRHRFFATLAAAILLAAAPNSTKAQQSPSVDEICGTLAQAASDNDLPEEFFTRLIWQEKIGRAHV